jgi:hypothetical protein
MSQLAFLAQDILTLLGFLSANAVRPVGTRYLPSSVLTKLCPLLVVSDRLAIHHVRTTTGRWNTGVRGTTSERHAERVRFIHYLAEAAHFVARTGAVLKPTPWFSRWLTASPTRAPKLYFTPHSHPNRLTPTINAGARSGCPARTWFRR